MKKLILLSLLTAIVAFAQMAPVTVVEILPERMGDFDRISLAEPPLEDPDVFVEFDYEAGEIGVYKTNDGRRTSVTAYRFYDDTGAYSAYLWLRDEKGVDDTYGERSWFRPGRNLIHFGNYVVDIRGDMPEEEHVELMLGQYLPNVRVSPDPPVLAYLPQDDITNGSQRYILGPTTLSKLAPAIPPSAAGFHFGTEAVYADYITADGPQKLVLFSYPTPEMARAQVDQFHAVEGILAKRTGPMIGVLLEPTDLDAAQVFLAKVRYRAEVTMNYQEPGRHDNLGNLILDIMILAGVLACLSILGGVFVAGSRIFATKVAPNSIFANHPGDAMTTLGIDDPDHRTS